MAKLDQAIQKLDSMKGQVPELDNLYKAFMGLINVYLAYVKKKEIKETKPKVIYRTKYKTRPKTLEQSFLPRFYPTTG